MVSGDGHEAGHGTPTVRDLQALTMSHAFEVATGVLAGLADSDPIRAPRSSTGGGCLLWTGRGYVRPQALVGRSSAPS